MGAELALCAVFGICGDGYSEEAAHEEGGVRKVKCTSGWTHYQAVRRPTHTQDMQEAHTQLRWFKSAHKHEDKDHHAHFKLNQEPKTESTATILTPVFYNPT